LLELLLRHCVGARLCDQCSAQCGAAIMQPPHSTLTMHMPHRSNSGRSAAA